MIAYIIRRLILIVPTIILSSLIIFFIIRLIPGDIIDAMIQSQEIIGSMEETRASLEHKMGIDRPIIVQYGTWIWGIFTRADFGDSLWKEAPVFDEIKARWPVTVELGLMALLIAQLIALPIGVYSALRQDTIGDYLARSFAILCIAIPGFWLGTLIVVFPSIWWGYTPDVVFIKFVDNPLGNLKQFIVPAIILGMALSGVTMRLTRTMMLEVLRQDYIRTAWAKGLRERVVVIRHALKNALIPVITIVGLQMGMLVGGTVIIETIFCLPGMGLLLLTSTQLRDYTIVTSIMFIFAIFMLLMNLLVDITYSFLDPRIRYK